MKTVDRRKCVICESETLEPSLTLEDFPIYMGASDEDPVTVDQCRKICKDCGCVQLSKLIPLDTLYKKGHNPSIGKTWEDHNRRFVSFLIKHCGKNILEVGGGNAKIASLILDNLDDSIKGQCKYTIYDKHYSENIPPELTKTYKFYDPSEDLLNSTQCDTIVSSHVVEHLYNPREYFESFYNRLLENGKVIFSAPNITQGIKDKLINTADLNFEHTYQLDEQYLEDMMSSCGFELLDTDWNNPYNMFMAFKKAPSTKKRLKLVSRYKTHKDLQEDYKKFHLRNASNLQQKISSHTNKFLFGCHISSQHLLHFGLNKVNFNGLLDSDPYKQGKLLYGTLLKTFSPEIIKSMNDVAVIVQMGIYTKEITSQLKKINPNCVIVSNASN